MIRWAEVLGPKSTSARVPAARRGMPPWMLIAQVSVITLGGMLRAAEEWWLPGLASPAPPPITTAAVAGSARMGARGRASASLLPAGPKAQADVGGKPRGEHPAPQPRRSVVGQPGDGGTWPLWPPPQGAPVKQGGPDKPAGGESDRPRDALHWARQVRRPCPQERCVNA